MKVNIYDEDNIAKGKLILENLAEDLKEYSKIINSSSKPSKEDGSKQQKLPAGKKAQSLEDIEKMGEEQVSISDALVQADDSDVEDLDEDSRPQFLQLVLKSTVQFREIDIDKMLEHTTLDDFVRGLYLNQGISQASVSGKGDGERMLDFFRTGDQEE